MSENNKTTIKVKLSGEDYHDIVIDWTDETCEYHQQIFQQLAAYTGIPILFISYSLIQTGESSFWLQNTNRLLSTPAKNKAVETARSRFNDGHCFNLRFVPRYVYSFGYDHLFDVCVDLIDLNYSHGNECNLLWCKHKNTRVYFDKIIGILTNSELQKKIKAVFPVERFSGNRDECWNDWNKLLANYNIKQYFDGYCIASPVPRDFRPYLPHQG